MRGKGILKVEGFDGVCPVCAEKMAESLDIIDGKEYWCGSCGCRFSLRMGGKLVSINAGIDPDSGERVVFGCYGDGRFVWAVNEKSKVEGSNND